VHEGKKFVSGLLFNLELYSIKMALMYLKSKITALVLGLLLTTYSFAQSSIPKEYIGVPGPILFDNGSYNLAWSSHPTGNYYKQEYLVHGENLEKFRKLILVEVLTGKTKLKDVVGAKVAELEKMKASNPVVHYESFEKDGELVLDFLLSENTPDDKYLNIVERNVYRYKTVFDQNGQNCVLLFGVSERAYGNDIDIFFSNLKANRYDLLNTLGAFAIPQIKLVKYTQ
jgi:hypothetical protein